MRGLSTAFSVCRKLLPAETVLGRGQIFIVMITIPIYAAFLASIQQSAGSHLLVPAIVLLLVSDMFIFFNTRVTLSSTVTVDKLKSEEMKRSSLQYFCTLIALVTAFFYATSDVKIMDYVNINELVTPLAMLATVVESVSRSTLTRIVSTDMVLNGLCQQRTDASRQDETQRKHHEESLGDLIDLFLDVPKSSSSTVAPVPLPIPVKQTAKETLKDKHTVFERRVGAE